MMDRHVNLISALDAAGAILLKPLQKPETLKLARCLRGQVSEANWIGCRGNLKDWCFLSCLRVLEVSGNLEFGTGWGN